MKIIIASDNGMVTSHFGHCQDFIVYEVENNRIMNKKVVVNPGHKKGYLPVFLSDLGANIVISGGMGGAAIQIFNDKDIDVVTGVFGKADEVIDEFLAGKIKSTGSICTEHQHHNNCE